MGQTRISISGRQFLINDIPVYADIPGSNPKVHGLLFNQRMIQGVFDDPPQRNLYNQLALKEFDPGKNTDGLIRALPEWYRWGLRAVTVCFQGGWPVGMGDVESIDNNPFGTDGMTLDPAYADRMDRVIRAADEIGMAVIVNILYWAQARKLKDARAVMNAVRTACRFLKEQKYTNVLIDVANEYDIFGNDRHPILQTDEGITALIQIAQAESGMPVGSSGTGGKIEKEPALASDFVIIHGNDLTRGKLYDMLLKQIEIAPDKPVLCNEDSPCCTRVDVCTELGVSWGYYNNYGFPEIHSFAVCKTTQHPDLCWEINKLLATDTDILNWMFANRSWEAVSCLVDTTGIDIMENEFSKVLYQDRLDHSFITDDYWHWREPLNSLLTNFFTGTMSPEDACTQLEADIRTWISNKQAQMK